MIDWGLGRYEQTATELDPVAESVVQMAAISTDEDVIDLACGTGNAALRAAALGAPTVGVDASPRLLEVARERARDQEVAADFREGDLLSLPVPDRCADVVLSVFGVIFASDPGRALREIHRVVRPSGRVLLSAWIPEGPIDAMLGAMGRVLGRVTQSPPPRRFPWSDPGAVGELAAEAGLVLQETRHGELAIRASSPEAYVLAGQEHPMAVAVRPGLERAGVSDEARDAMTAVLREANEDAGAFLVHSPYVVHRLHVRDPEVR